MIAAHTVLCLLTQAKMIFGNHAKLVHLLCLKQKTCSVSRAVLAWWQFSNSEVQAYMFLFLRATNNCTFFFFLLYCFFLPKGKSTYQNKFPCMILFTSKASEIGCRHVYAYKITNIKLNVSSLAFVKGIHNSFGRPSFQLLFWNKL